MRLSLVSQGPQNYTGVGGNLSAVSPNNTNDYDMFKSPLFALKSTPCRVDQSPLLGVNGISGLYTGRGNCSDVLVNNYTLTQVPPKTLEFVNWACFRGDLWATYSIQSTPFWMVRPATRAIIFNLVCVARYQCPTNTTLDANSMECKGAMATFRHKSKKSPMSMQLQAKKNFAYIKCTTIRAVQG